jgi:bifunctional polynucleotide phosphatase/kinase
MNPEQRTILPAVAFRGYTSRFEEPQLTEGFKDIVTVPFQFEGDEAQREIWSKYWL